MSDNEPKILFAGQWVPAHSVWKKLEAASIAADVIERFNSRFPTLSTESTRIAPSHARRHLKGMELDIGRSKELARIGDIACELLKEYPPEDVLEILARDHDVEWDLVALIEVAGAQAYTDALAAEAGEMQANRILPEQLAQVWNDLGRPAPGGGLWNKRKIEELLNKA